MKKLTVWLVCLGLAGLSAADVQAQPAEPVDFGGLVLGGSIGALVGGVGGGLAAYGICRATTPAGPWADLACLAGAMLFGYIPGVSLGATVGVNIAGNSQKIEGNLWLALGGAILGEALAYFVFDWALRSLGETPHAQQLRDVLIPIVFFGGIPISAGTGAALGYTLTGRSRTE